MEVEVAVEEDDMVLVDLDSLALANDSSEVMETLRTPFSTLLLPMRESPFMTELSNLLDVSGRQSQKCYFCGTGCLIWSGTWVGMTLFSTTC